MQKRLAWIDALKGISIIAVVLAHFNSPIFEFISSWVMPVFLMIAGFFFDSKVPLKKRVQGDFKRLMIPYFIFCGFALVIEAFKRLALNRPPLIISHELLGVFWRMSGDSLSQHYGIVLWFLPALFFARLIVTILQNLTNGDLALMFFISSALFVVGIKIPLALALDQALISSLWIIFGQVLFKKTDKMSSPVWLYVFPCMFLIFLTFSIPHLHMPNKEYVNPLVNILWSVGMFFMLTLMFKSKYFPESLNSWLTFFGRHSMAVFILHPYTNNVAHLAVKLIDENAWVLKLILSLLLLYPVLLLKDRFPNRFLFRYL